MGTVKNQDDPIKRIFGKTAEEIFAKKDKDHTDFHSSNAFCRNAGPEEMRYLQLLLDDLSDDQVAALLDAAGIRFGWPTKDIDRDTLEGVLDVADREVFYKECHRVAGKDWAI